jgi:osmotically-inducible protein OsmY
MKTNSGAAALLLLLTLASPIVFTACAGSTRRTSRAVPDDATITTRVKTALLNEREITSKIDVDTFKGVVTLSGSVKTAAERDRAMALARTITGVTDVKSALQLQ